MKNYFDDGWIYYYRAVLIRHLLIYHMDGCCYQPLYLINPFNLIKFSTTCNLHSKAVVLFSVTGSLKHFFKKVGNSCNLCSTPVVRYGKQSNQIF